MVAKFLRKVSCHEGIKHSDKFSNTHLTDGVRASENDVRKWVSIRKSKLVDSSFGLFTETSFKKGILSLFLWEI